MHRARQHSESRARERRHRLAHEAALRSFQRLYANADDVNRVPHLRQAALDAMTSMQAFEPRLLGAVLEGVVDEYTPVQLHVFTDALYEFDEFLARAGLKAIDRVRKIRLDRTRTLDADVRILRVDEIDYDITILPHDCLRQAPLAPGSDKPVPRVSMKQLKGLMDTDATAERKSVSAMR